MIQRAKLVQNTGARANWHPLGLVAASLLERDLKIPYLSIDWLNGT